MPRTVHTLSSVFTPLEGEKILNVQICDPRSDMLTKVLTKISAMDEIFSDKHVRIFRYGIPSYGKCFDELFGIITSRPDWKLEIDGSVVDDVFKITITSPKGELIVSVAQAGI